MLNSNNTNMSANLKLSNTINDNINMFKQLFSKNDTVIYREFQNQRNPNVKFCLIYTDGMIDKEVVNEHIILPLMKSSFRESLNPQNMLNTFTNQVVIAGAVEKASDVNEMISSICYGDSLLLVEGVSEALIIDTKAWPTRAVGEPESEKGVRGSREGFTESIMLNLTMVRRRLRTHEFKEVFKEVGQRSKTQICISYIEGIAQDTIVNEVLKRVNAINIDGVLESEYIEEFIKDSPYSLFKTIGNTESPDIVVAKLLEGKVAIFCDGTPFVLTMPYLFVEYFQVPEDYYNNYLYSSFNRLLRYLAFFLGTSVPAVYAGIVTFHQELIPTSLLLSISASRRGIPLPTVVEAIVMLIGFDLLREGGIRIQKPIGQTISIVGALILGEAAVNARIISSPMVIVVASTALSSFLIPKMKGAFIIIRLIFLFLASFLGLYGYIFGVMTLFLYLMSLESFGVPYMLYTYSFNTKELKDTLVRAPWKTQRLRPKVITKDRSRNNTKGKG